jgi:hypothetical protein
MQGECNPESCKDAKPVLVHYERYAIRLSICARRVVIGSVSSSSASTIAFGLLDIASNGRGDDLLRASRQAMTFTERWRENYVSIAGAAEVNSRRNNFSGGDSIA